MTIKSIALHDFRQFKGDQVVEFSTDPNRNVTLILGQNGAGKTTFAQAFKWCLYGDTDFMDKNVLNRKVAYSLGPNENAEARVALSLVHSGVPYEIIRSQKYSANDKGEMNRTYNTKLEVWRVAGDGNRQAVKNAELAVKEILPKGLSKYFFFDGERIRLMSEEVSVGKSAEFKDAVERLLGLSAIKRALLHLKEMRPTASVIRSYEKELNTGADKRIAECNDIIDKADSQLRGIENRDKELDKEIAAIESTIKTLENELVENKASEALAKENAAQRKMLSNNENSKSAQIKQLLMSFNQNALSYLSRSLVAKCVEELSRSDVLDKGIPDVTAKTIAFLKKRGKCLCGECLKEGTKEWAELEKLLEFVPPKSLGSFVNDFLDDAKRREKDTMGYFEEFSVAYNGIREIDSIIDECNEVATLPEFCKVEKRIAQNSQ